MPTHDREVLEFLQALHGDPGLRARFEAAPSAEAFLSLARERGCDFELARLRAALERVRSEPIPDEQLDAVAGGTGESRPIPAFEELTLLAERVYEFILERTRDEFERRRTI